MERVRKLLNENKNLKALEEERDRLDKLKDAFNEAHGAYDEFIANEEERKASYLWYDIRDRTYFEMRLKLVERIHSLQQSGTSKSSQSQAGSIKSGNSRRTKTSISKTSVNSRASSGRSLKLEAAAKTARLKTEMTFLERDNEIRKMQLTKEIAIAEAEERAINEALTDERKEIAIKQEPLNPSASSFISISTLHHARETTETKPKVTPACAQDNPDNSPTMVPAQTQQRENFAIKQEINPANSQPINYETPFQEPLKLINLQTKQAELISLLVEQQKRNILPAKEPPLFSGNAFDYQAFVTAFDSIISENVSLNKDHLDFLEKYIVGRANEIVRGFLLVNSESAYTEARKPLDQRFGNPVHVAEAYKWCLFNWSQIKDGDSAGL